MNPLQSRSIITSIAMLQRLWLFNGVLRQCKVESPDRHIRWNICSRSYSPTIANSSNVQWQVIWFWPILYTKVSPISQNQNRLFLSFIRIVHLFGMANDNFSSIWRVRHRKLCRFRCLHWLLSCVRHSDKGTQRTQHRRFVSQQSTHVPTYLNMHDSVEDTLYNTKHIYKYTCMGCICI